jgi:hypothetical protein
MKFDRSEALPLAQRTKNQQGSPISDMSPNIFDRLFPVTFAGVSLTQRVDRHPEPFVWGGGRCRLM